MSSIKKNLKSVGRGRQGESRQFPRYRNAGKRIGFKQMIRALDSEVEQEGVVVDNGNGGLCLWLDAPLKRQQVLRISLPCLNQKATAPTLGEVRWVKKKALDEEEGYWVGVQYLL